MTYFAKIDENNLVVDVIAADQAHIDTLPDKDSWLQTGYEPQYSSVPTSGRNYAGIGFTYDKVMDAFIPPKPFPSWILNTQDYQWQPPVPYPDDGNGYVWDEQTQSWVLFTQGE